jgi:broad specificity phosphatase PhoE
MEGQPVTHDSHTSLIADAQNWSGERLNDFVDRVMDAVEEALAYHGSVLIVSHGGAFWAIQHRLGMNGENNIANALPVLFKQDGQNEKVWVAEEV